MKKLVLATAVAAIATSANAATVYEGNGLTYKLDGVIKVQLRQKIGDDQPQDIEFDDLEIRNFASYDLGNDMTAFGRLDYSFDDTGSTGGKLEEGYVGLGFGATEVLVGKTTTPGNNFGVEKAYEGAGTVLPLTSSDDSIQVSTSVGPVSVAAAYDMAAKTSADSVNDRGFDLLVEGSFDALSVQAAYQSYATAGAKATDAWGLAVSFDAGMADFGVDYSDLEDTSSAYNVAAGFAVAPTTSIKVGLQNEDLDTGAETTYYYANLTYAFPAAKNVSVFAEIADSDANNVDMGYLAGMQVKF